MSFSSPTPSLTPSTSSSPSHPVQPDHFYGSEDIQLPPSPTSDGKFWLDPEDDPLAHRGIPVFKPTMEEFQDFEGYVSKIECWGSRSGIVKVIPPNEWTSSLPQLKEQLMNVKIRTPIEQHMLGRGGLFRQENMEKRKVMSVREWADLCAKEEFRAPGIGEVGLQSRNTNVKTRTRKTKKQTESIKAESIGPDIKREISDSTQSILFANSELGNSTTVLSPPDSVSTPPSSCLATSGDVPAETEDALESKAKTKKRVALSKEAKEAALAARSAHDSEFLETFDPHTHWLPPNTTAANYTREFCQILERHYWRNCGLGKPAWYGADTQGSLYTDETTAWNVAHLPSMLSRLLPADNQGLPGVNTPYLYFGMWRATFAWHVEDMDLFSINFIHFGAPKFWYSIPQGRAAALEQTMRGYFPKDTSNCSQFLRHKSFLASPTLLAQSSCRPNFLVQHSGEFVITFPRGYHAGFNLGFNCAESVNFALESWLELGRRAKACECISDSVRIDVDQLLRDRAAEAEQLSKPTKPQSLLPKKSNQSKVARPKSSHKRKIEKSGDGEGLHAAKKLKIKLSPSKASSVPKISITLKLGPRPAALEPFPCCLCVSMDKTGLLRVYDPPVGRKDAEEAAGSPKNWKAHEYCANVIPETWVDEIEAGSGEEKEKVVYGVDGIVKDRWHLKCASCTKNRTKAHGAPIQCTKGKCPKAFHVSCARDGADSGILFDVLREVEKEVLLMESTPLAPATATAPNFIESDMMQVEVPTPADLNETAEGSPSSRVLKVIKKLEVQVLCLQHNPVVAAAKKEAKQDRIKSDLLALPPMARIKIRVSSGVFEVSLIRVIEATNSVEVLWDKNEKKEFKWGSVIFGNTDGPVQQKPSEPGLKPDPAPLAGLPAPTYPSAQAVVSPTPRTSGDTSQPTTHPHNVLSPYPYAPPAGAYWQYHSNPHFPVPSSSQSYPYAGYFTTASNPAGSPQTHYSLYAYPQNQYQYWQQAYQGPSTDTQSAQPQPQPQPPVSGQSPSTEDQNHPPDGQPQSAGSAVTKAHSGLLPETLSPEVQRALFTNLTALSSLQPAQFSDMLRDNPHLRDIVMAAIREAQKAPAPV